jgi:hypothetical protein
MLLQVEESGGALDVRQRLRAGHLLPLEDLARAKCPLELADELLKVVLHHPVERDQVAVQIVEHFDRCWLGAHEEKRGAPAKTST